MPKFISNRDVTFFKGIAREIVDDVIQNICVLFKINLNETKINLYKALLNPYTVEQDKNGESEVKLSKNNIN